MRSITRPLTALLVTGLVATACGSDTQVTDERDGDTASGALTTVESTTTTTTTVPLGGGGVSATDTTTTTEPPAPAPETTTTTTTTTTTEPPAPAPEDCLVGQWRLRSQEFLDEIISSIPPEATGGITPTWTYVSGEYLFDFNADGTTRGQRLAWTHSLGSAEGNLITTIDSDDSGTYSVEGNMISVADDASSATVTVGVEIGGVVQPLPIGGTQQVGTDAISGSGTFTCEGDVLEVNLTDLPDAPPGGFRTVLDRV